MDFGLSALCGRLPFPRQALRLGELVGRHLLGDEVAVLGAGIALLGCEHPPQVELAANRVAVTPRRGGLI